MPESLAQALSTSASTNPLLWIVGVLLLGELLSRVVSRFGRNGRWFAPKTGRDCPHCVGCKGKHCSRSSAEA
jgi:hypothetical protein